jgi:hypothetical protein
MMRVEIGYGEHMMGMSVARGYQRGIDDDRD